MRYFPTSHTATQPWKRDTELETEIAQEPMPPFPHLTDHRAQHEQVLGNLLYKE